MCRPGAILLLLITLLGTHALGLELRDTRWGFDGTVVPGRLNLLSVQLSNGGSQSFEGIAELRESANFRETRGTPYRAPVFINPRSEIWIQFTVWIAPGRDEFTLQCGGNESRISPPPLGPPAQVFLTTADARASGQSSVPHFPSFLFPRSVAATDGLDAVLVDAMPRWDPVRQDAFLDWIRRGGSVLLLPPSDGNFPTFADRLAVLNGSAERTNFGAGRIIRLPAPRPNLTAKVFAEHGVAPVALEPSSQASVGDLDQTLLANLAHLTRPKIRWALIGLLTVCYVLLIGPAHYLLGRRLDYRLSLAGFVGCVAIFSLLLGVTGKRGFGEAQTVHSLALARSLGSGRFDVTQWISAFATRSARYRITHDSVENFYAAPSVEPVPEAITSGPAGHYLADIPLYSSRQFLHRAVMAGDDTSFTVERWEENASGLAALTLKLPAGFPAEPLALHARFGERFYPLQRAGDRLTLSPGARSLSFAEFLPQPRVRAVMSPSIGFLSSDSTPSAERLRELLPALQLAALEGREHLLQFLNRGPQPPDRLQLLIFAKSPASFRLRAEGFAQEHGYVLYVQSVIRPAPDAPPN